MPLSFLVHTSRLTIASVIRPCARGQSRNNGNNNRNINTSACTHGFGIKTTPGLVSSKAHLKRTTSASALDMKILARLFSSQAVVGVLGLSGVLGCRTGTTNGNANGTKNVKAIQSRNHSGCATKYAPEIEELFHGNVDYIQSMNKMNPGLLANLAKNGQREWTFSSLLFIAISLFFSSPRRYPRLLATSLCASDLMSSPSSFTSSMPNL